MDIQGAIQLLSEAKSVVLAEIQGSMSTSINITLTPAS